MGRMRMNPARAVGMKCFIMAVFLVLAWPAARPCSANPDQNPETVAVNITAFPETSPSIDSYEPLSCPKIDINDVVVRAGLLYDATMDTVIWEKNINQAVPIASLTKMMVGLLTIEDIRDGRTDWNVNVRVTPEATRVGGFSVSLQNGRTLSVEDLLKAAMISSGNDAAYLLAQFLEGSETLFVRRMNRRAAELGMRTTRFSNATGMPARQRSNDNHASPYDLLILCREMLKHEELLRIAGMDETVIFQSGRPIRLRNHNRLVGVYDEVDGLKTGFTRNAQFCLAATAVKDGRRLIAIALGVPSRDLRNRLVEDMLCRYYTAAGEGPLNPRSATAIARSEDCAPLNISAAIVHRIQGGDTLYGIARTYGCSVHQLKTWNRLNGNLIRPGKQLKIYPSATTASGSGLIASAGAAPAAVIYYMVQPGDTLWRIARQYKGVSVKHLMRINNISRASRLKAGQTIKIIPEFG
jgi:D-alanyl-D-alanine carboxypeptidase